MKIKNLLQKIRLKLGKILLDKKTQGNLSALPPEKILFLRHDGKIGDYIVSSFVFREIKKYNSNTKIGVICTKKNEYLFKQNRYIDEIYLVKKRSVLSYIKQALHIRKKEYDVVIDPTIMIRNRDLLLLNLIGAKNYLGYKKENYKIFNLNLNKEKHFSSLYCDALEKIGITVDDIRYDVPCNIELEKEVNDFLVENKVSDFITINFYGAGKNRRVNDINIVKYLDYLQKNTNKKIVVLSSPDSFLHLKGIVEKFDHIFIHNTKLIYHTIALIKASDLLISVDTATVHIASGFNKPIIALYSEGKENFTHWHPNSQSECHILFYKDNINELLVEDINPEWLNK